VKQSFKLIVEADVPLHGTVFLSGRGGVGRGGVSRKKSESTNSTPSSTDFKNFYTYDSSPVYVLNTWLLKKRRSISAFYELIFINFDSK